MVFMTAILLAACSPKQQEGITITETVRSDTSESDDDYPRTDQPAEDSEDLTGEESEETAGVSQEELDQLKRDIEDMEFEDLGGLSE